MTEQLKLVAKFSTGFIYLVSRTGVTGEQTSVSSSIGPLLARTRAVTGLPLAVGFGISSAAQVLETGAAADGVVVGSAFVRLIDQADAVAVSFKSLRSIVGATIIYHDNFVIRKRLRKHTGKRLLKEGWLVISGNYNGD